MRYYTPSYTIRGIFLLLFLLAAIQAEARWIEQTRTFQHIQAIPNICSEMMLANNTPLIVDTTRCLDQGLFNINSKYITEDNQKAIATLIKLNTSVGSLNCRAKIKRTFDHKFVNHHGEIQVKKAGWKVVYVNDCQGDYHPEALIARLEDANVKKLSHQEFLKLPEKTRANLRRSNLLSELGEDDYRYLETHYYKVENSSKALIGIIEHSKLLQIDDNSNEWYLVRHNKHGDRLGEIE